MRSPIVRRYRRFQRQRNTSVRSRNQSNHLRVLQITPSPQWELDDSRRQELAVDPPSKRAIGPKRESRRHTIENGERKICWTIEFSSPGADPKVFSLLEQKALDHDETSAPIERVGSCCDNVDTASNTVLHPIFLVRRKYREKKWTPSLLTFTGLPGDCLPLDGPRELFPRRGEVKLSDVFRSPTVPNSSPSTCELVRPRNW